MDEELYLAIVIMCLTFIGAIIIYLLFENFLAGVITFILSLVISLISIALIEELS